MIGRVSQDSDRHLLSSGEFARQARLSAKALRIYGEIGLLRPAEVDASSGRRVMHGLADDNVHPAHTLRLSAALLAAGRPHELLLLPGIGHHAIGSAITETLLDHQLRFLQRYLEVDPAASR